MDTILSINHISHSYHTLKGETPALYDISFSVNQGEFLAVVGPSGCGKSTLLSLISGLLQPEKGEILLHGKPIEEQKDKIGYMLQRDELLEWRSIYRNVLLGPEIQHSLNPEVKKRAHELLDAYGLGQFQSSRPSELSGGMRQRAALVRTLILNPEVLLLDEPFSALDYQTRLNVSDDIGQIIRRERRYGSFARSFDVSGIDVEHIGADYKNGVLELTLPKANPVQPQSRRIELR